tara:strand:+ start:176 stop:316 length:141 start_codon:yes stop_codon:yes gene_type:complete
MQPLPLDYQLLLVEEVLELKMVEVILLVMVDLVVVVLHIHPMEDQL